MLMKKGRLDSGKLRCVEMKRLPLNAPHVDVLQLCFGHFSHVGFCHEQLKDGIGEKAN